MIFILGNAFWPENLRTAEISQSIVRRWNMEVCCFCRAEISSATHKKKRKLLHRNACADARSRLSRILNQRREKMIKAFAETSCFDGRAMLSVHRRVGQAGSTAKIVPDLDASSPVKTRYPIWISLFPRQLHINEPPISGGSDKNGIGYIFTRPFLPDRWRQFEKKMEGRKRSG